MNFLPEITKGRGQYVPYDLEANRVDAIWSKLRHAEQVRGKQGQTATKGHALDGPRSAWTRPWGRPQWSLAGGVLVAAACALMIFQFGDAPQPSAWSGARLQAGNEAVRVALQDGSEIEAHPHASIELLNGDAKEVRLALRSGSGRFVVAKNRGRNFIVEAGSVQIRVVGTRFEVSRDREQNTVQVLVDEGIVEVRSQGRVSRLHAGEQILLNQQTSDQPSGQNAGSGEPLNQASETSEDDDHEANASPGAFPTDAPTDEGVEGIEITEAELAAAMDAQGRRRHGRRALRAQAQAAAQAHDQTHDQTSPATIQHHRNPALRPPPNQPIQTQPAPMTTSERAAADTATGARALLEEAQRAQAAGQRRRAAQLYQQIIEHHPQDARAALAAFELGRVRMDYLGDARGAMAAFQWSLRTTTSAFREDAMARLVRSAEVVDRNACRTHRTAYLTDYPSGRYADDVRRRCNPE